jgi:hypothetical protein
MATIDVTWLGTLVTAIGGLGVAATGLTDAFKTLPGGGISKIGFTRIQFAVGMFLPELKPGQARARSGKETNLTSAILPILHANWINGMAASDQRDTARALIKMRLDTKNAEGMAKVAQVDVATLEGVATKVTTGDKLTDDEKNVLGRFDLALASILDAAYQEASQQYRNWSKLVAGFIAVGIGAGGGLLYDGHLAIGAACGIFAVPLAPIAKDLVSALSAGVGVAQAARRKA